MVSEVNTPEQVKSQQSSCESLEPVTPDYRENDVSYRTCTYAVPTLPDSRSGFSDPQCIENNTRKKTVEHQSYESHDSTWNVMLNSNRKGNSIEDSDPFSNAYLQAKNSHKLGRLEKALEYYGKALRIKNRTIKTEPREIQIDVADILFSVGEIHMFSKFDERAKCVQAFDMCIDLRRHCFGSSHPSVARALYKLSAVYFSMGEKEYSMSLLVETVSILHSADCERKDIAEVWHTMSRVQQSLGQYEEADSSYNEALSLLMLDKKC
jgi:tetratricopeptide (TPR) repeat protein